MSASIDILFRGWYRLSVRTWVWSIDWDMIWCLPLLPLFASADICGFVIWELLPAPLLLDNPPRDVGRPIPGVEYSSEGGWEYNSTWASDWSFLWRYGSTTVDVMPMLSGPPPPCGKENWSWLRVVVRVTNSPTMSLALLVLSQLSRRCSPVADDSPDVSPTSAVTIRPWWSDGSKT